MKKYSSNSPMMSNKDAAKIGKFIDVHFSGNVTPEQLLNVARDEKSFLHQYFEWDDSEAAERYRLNQARSLIVSIYVEADDLRPIRNFLRVNVGTGSSYLNCDQVKQSADLVDQVIIAAKDQLVRWQDRYARYCEFFEFNFKIKGKKHVISSSKEKGRKASIDSGR